ncbi:MAG: hypothetical protein HQL39_12510 [Alphaproteobacteria bacterium]|nr:hypothetical protein [Alphaproteobacteria bacterium]
MRFVPLAAALIAWAASPASAEVFCARDGLRLECLFPAGAPPRATIAARADMPGHLVVRWREESLCPWRRESFGSGTIGPLVAGQHAPLPSRAAGQALTCPTLITLRCSLSPVVFGPSGAARASCDAVALMVAG